MSKKSNELVFFINTNRI